jgi:predicted amidohydrolase YtcJ
MKKLLAALAGLLLAAPAAADLLVDNVNGYTLDREGRLVRFAALRVGDDGRVAQLYAKDEARPAADRRVDGAGRTLVPGLIDGHGHVMGLGFTALQLDLSDTKTLAEAQAKIAAFAREYPGTGWILGRGWNQETWKLGRFPTAADIDAVVPGRPVWLERVDGHAGWANRAAMEAAGIGAATASPPGGRIEQANGAPSGIFVDAAMELVNKIVPPPSPEQRKAALEAAQRILLAQGITATADMGTSAEDWKAMRSAGEAGELDLRILAYASGLEPLAAIAPSGPTEWLHDDRLRLVGVKIYSDGALGSRGAWLKHPYKDAPGQTGLSFLGDDALRQQMDKAAAAGFQVAVHAIGDAANAQLLGAIEGLAAVHAGDRRWRIEHAQIVDPADLPRFGRNGIIASMQPVHQASDWRMAEARMGKERLGGAYAWTSMLEHGARLAFGSDFPVESPNPFHGLAVAVSREDAEGQPPGGWMPGERLTLVQALAGFTTGAAYAGFAEDRIGSLEPGRFADFLLIDRDPFAGIDPAALRDTRVLETWVSGRKVYSAAAAAGERGGE